MILFPLLLLPPCLLASPPLPSSPIPVIDISALFSSDANERASLGHKWDDAMRGAGFALITGHSVPREAIDALYNASTVFFGYDHNTKMEACLNSGYGAGGYVPVGVEAVARSRPEGAESAADVVENLVFSYAGDPQREAVMPGDPPSLQPAVRAYWAHMLRLMRDLMHLSSLALGLTEGYFDAYFENPKCNLRLAHYPAIAEDDEVHSSGAMRYGAHTDYTGFTILRQDPEADGLQAQMADGQWVAVPSRPDALVINAGDLIQVWTNDRWRSPPHRVIKPPSGKAAPPRLSIVFFTGPDEETMIEALPTCVEPETNPARHAPISAQNHLKTKLQASNTV